MSNIVSLTDFTTGEFKIAQNRFTEDDITSFILKYERRYLVELFGAELYALFFDDLTGTPAEPQDARFVTVFEEGQWDDIIADGPLISDGIKEMLKGIVFFHYIRDNNMYHTITGLVSNNNENANAEIKEKGAQYILKKYAHAMETFTAIQEYMKDNSDVYPEFKGKEIEQSGFFF
jgi:hypothetical protein